jgi:hypothetical protein
LLPSATRVVTHGAAEAPGGPLEGVPEGDRPDAGDPGAPEEPPQPAAVAVTTRQSRTVVVSRAGGCLMAGN